MWNIYLSFDFENQNSDVFFLKILTFLRIRILNIKCQEKIVLILQLKSEFWKKGQNYEIQVKCFTCALNLNKCFTHGPNHLLLSDGGQIHWKIVSLTWTNQVSTKITVLFVQNCLFVLLPIHSSSAWKHSLRKNVWNCVSKRFELWKIPTRFDLLRLLKPHIGFL